MVRQILVKGYKNFTEVINSVELKNQIKYCLFSGDKDESGVSWCPDCVKYEPVVSKAMKELDDDGSVYIYCLVGGRDYWKGRKNEFRTDPNLKLTGIPTFLKYGSAQKLVEDQLRPDLISILLEDD